jgi:hypothetical protein
MSPFGRSLRLPERLVRVHQSLSSRKSTHCDHRCGPLIMGSGKQPDPRHVLNLTTQNACAIIPPAKYLSRNSLVLWWPFCVPVRIAERKVIGGQVLGCAWNRTLVRSRERDHCFRVKLTSFSMKQTSAPGLGAARGGAPAPLGLTGACAVCPSDERDGPLFPKKSTTSQPSKQTSDLCFSEKPAHRSLRNKHPSLVSPSSPVFVLRAFAASPGASAVMGTI